jgi:hypothetical protein
MLRQHEHGKQADVRARVHHLRTPHGETVHLQHAARRTARYLCPHHRVVRERNTVPHVRPTNKDLFEQKLRFIRAQALEDKLLRSGSLQQHVEGATLAGFEVPRHGAWRAPQGLQCRSRRGHSIVI